MGKYGTPFVNQFFEHDRSTSIPFKIKNFDARYKSIDDAQIEGGGECGGQVRKILIQTPSVCCQNPLIPISK
jgi:hypothetical protein